MQSKHYKTKKTLATVPTINKLKHSSNKILIKDKIFGLPLMFPCFRPPMFMPPLRRMGAPWAEENISPDQREGTSEWGHKHGNGT
jgi:hypothetical protein